ncbi:MAG: chemotaxis methyltransferase CheR [Methanocella sp. PtaU1.Bin125]|nr:MAG: chemotaxis methyltransferase CheR [Methanocella sp. PtaU1.Bin125]
MENIADPELRNLIRKVHSRTGIDLGQYKDSYIARRLSTRMKVLGAMTYGSYARMLDAHADEYDKVVDAFTINVSEFFRDRDAYRVIREKVIPAIVADKVSTGRRSLRVWSAGCACGEEVYSISMILHDVLGKEYDRFAIRLYATDIDDAIMKRAQEGLYDPVSLKNVEKSFLERFTKATPDGKIAVNDTVKRNVTFRHYDLINGGPFGGYFDLILCRNVMIYFSEPQKKKLIGHFFDALNPGGYLVIGKTETLTADTRAAFIPAYGLERIYRKPERSLV